MVFVVRHEASDKLINKDDRTNFSNIESAAQTEIQLVEQHLSDALWVEHGRGVKAERPNGITGERGLFGHTEVK